MRVRIASEHRRTRLHRCDRSVVGTRNISRNDSTPSHGDRRMHVVLALLASALISGSTTTTAKLPQPSRHADQGCKWESINDATLGLAAWVEACKHGSSEIHFVVSPPSLTMVDSDVKGPPYAVVDVIDLE